MTDTLKALVGDIQKFSTQDGPGMRSTVFLKGCPLNCVWCHNPEMICQEQQMIITPSRCIGCGVCTEVCPGNIIAVDENGPSIDFGLCSGCGKCAEACYAKAISPVAREMSVDEIMTVILQDRKFYGNSGGGVTVSGGELLSHGKFAGELADACGREGIQICLDTCGYGDSEMLMNLALKDNIQFVLYDIKHMDSEEHRRLTGAGNELILNNLKMLAADSRTHDKIWIRIPLIKNINDGDDAMGMIAKLMKKLNLRRLSLLPYHEMGIAKAKNTGGVYHRFEAPSGERIREIEEIFEGMEII